MRVLLGISIQLKGSNYMHFLKIRKLAKGQGIRPGKLTKINLVREIQRKEGNFDCFATAVTGECDQEDCLWRDDCLTVSKAALSA